MRIHHKQDYSAQMAAFTEKIRKEPNQDGVDNLSNEKLELLQEFVKYLESDKHEKHKCKHRHEHHGKFGGRGHRFMFGHGFGKHGHGHHGKHHHGFEKHHHGHGGHGGHGKHGRHHHGGRPFWMMGHGGLQEVVEIDTSATEVVTETNIGHQAPHHRGFRDHWLKCKRNQCKADQSSQTEVRTEPEDNLASQVQNISIENPSTVDLMNE